MSRVNLLYTFLNKKKAPDVLRQGLGGIQILFLVNVIIFKVF